MRQLFIAACVVLVSALACHLAIAHGWNPWIVIPIAGLLTPVVAVVIVVMDGVTQVNRNTGARLDYEMRLDRLKREDRQKRDGE